MSRNCAYTAAALEAAEALEARGEHRHANAVRAICRKFGTARGAVSSHAAENARLRFEATRPRHVHREQEAY